MMPLKYSTETKTFSDLKNSVDIPKFQRSLVWSTTQKESFIKSLKAGLPIGVLLLAKKKNEDRYLVIDGLQRLTTMMDYDKDYFKYVSKDEITDADVLMIIASSSHAQSNYDSYTESVKVNTIEEIRNSIIKCIVEDTTKNTYSITTAIADFLCNNCALFGAQDKFDVHGATFGIIERFQKDAKIDELKIPVIMFTGSEEELAIVFQKLNQEGVKLTKYDVFAATWINHTVTIKDDDEFIDIVIKKYNSAQTESNLEIDGYDPDQLKADGILTVFEYAFAIGKAIVNKCQHLFTGKKDDSQIEAIGFDILAELLGLSYAKMGDLAETIDKYNKVDYKALKDAIVECASEIEGMLGNYIISPSTKPASLACQSELQLVSYIVVLFKLKYTLSVDAGMTKNKSYTKYVNDMRAYLFKHYLYDIIRDYWASTGDTKLEEIIAEPLTCRYIKDVDKSSFEQAIDEWMKEANSKKISNSVTAQTKLFLNYLLRLRVSDVDRVTYDIEHCVPKKQIQDYFLNKNKEVPMSTVCNLVYIPTKENRSKGDQTYYQRQAKDPTTFKLDENALINMVYPSKAELAFVEAKATMTPSKYLAYLDTRRSVMKKAFIDALYGV